MGLKKLEEDLLKAKNPQKAKFLARFFKTGKGEYGQGDIFLGITVPKQREIAKKYTSLSFDDLQKLLSSKIHEQRLVSLLILISKYKKADGQEKEKIYKFYLKNAKNINNWDLVDLSSHLILGDYLLERDKEILFKLAKSQNLWEKRIAVISTFFFIKNNCFSHSLKIAELLLADKHDLIHKSVGWMLREIGKKDQKTEEEFLNKHYKKMPRTMLRYAIERFGEEKRRYYLS